MKIAEYQKIEKKILFKFKQVCEENNIEYFLTFGTLLGAVRHKNLITWDDDIDVFLKRKDYEKLIKLPQEVWGDEYTLFRETDDIYYDNTTRLLYKEISVLAQKHEEFGKVEFLDYPCLDIMILDNEFDNAFKRMYRNIGLIVFYGMLLGHRYTKNYSKYSKKIIPIIFILGSIGKLFNCQKLRKCFDHFCTLCKDDNVKNYICSNDCLPDIIIYKYSREWFDSKVDLPIDDEVFSCPIGYDGILKKIYGDYMKLPEEEKRKNYHKILEEENDK